MNHIVQLLWENTMKTKRLFSLEKKKPTVTCNRCKYGYLVDKQNDKYYCIPPNGKCWLYHGRHYCEQGELK